MKRAYLPNGDTITVPDEKVVQLFQRVSMVLANGCMDLYKKSMISKMGEIRSCCLPEKNAGHTTKHPYQEQLLVISIAGHDYHIIVRTGHLDTLNKLTHPNEIRGSKGNS